MYITSTLAVSSMYTEYELKFEALMAHAIADVSQLELTLETDNVTFHDLV